MPHIEKHRSHRTGWLRAAVLGANDGIVSTASLIIGVAAADSSRDSILIAGLAGLVAGAMSMAAGEYVSVSSQADTVEADLAIERRALEQDAEAEQEELADIYVKRGLDRSLARTVAEKLMAHDALGAHARDDIGITENMDAQPIVAALISAVAFSTGAALPLTVAWSVPLTQLISLTVLLSLMFLACLGAIAARIGGAPMIRGAARVTVWGGGAMAITGLVGHVFGIAV